MTHIEPTDNEILRTASQEALTSTETISDDVKRAEIRAALQAALAEPKAEPVAWHVSFNGGESWTVYEFNFKPDITDNNNGVLVRPLYYTHPPVSEPVAYLARHTSGDVQVATTIHGIYRDTALSIEPLYLHPPVPEPLLESDIVTMYAECPTCDADMIEFARAIEAAIRSKT